MTSYLAQANTGSDNLVSSRSVTKPANVTAGAVGVFWLVRWSETASFPAVTPPSGAVLRGTIVSGTMQTLCHLHRVGAETAFNYAWTGSRWSCLAAVWFDGVDPALDLAMAPFQSATGNGTSITTLTADTANGAALAWQVTTIDSASGVTHEPPTGFTEVADVPPWATAYRIAPSNGAQPASGATLSGSRLWTAGLVALAPTPTGTSGDAAAALTTTLTADGIRGTAGPAALAISAPLDAAGQRTAVSSTALAADATLAAAGQRSTAADANLAATAALSTQGRLARTGGTAMTATATLTAAGSTTTAGDDIDLAVGAPYSPWSAGLPHDSGWKVGAPC